MGAMSDLDMTYGDMRRRLISAQISLQTATALITIERGNALRKAASEYEDIAQIDALVSSALGLIEMTIDDIGSR